MDLRITDIEFTNFRNYSSWFLHEIEDLTIFVGPNAVGKTNIIEGIQLITALTSFRNATAKQLLAWDSTFARTEATIKNQSRCLSVVMRIQDEKRSYLLNGKPKRVQDIKGLLPSVVFSPDDLDLIKGSQSGKRAALDTLGSQLTPNYYVIKKDYEKILQHKNRLLKDDGSQAFLDSINETLVKIGAQLCCYRSALFTKLLVEIKRYYSEITGFRETIDARYVPSWIDHDPDICEPTFIEKNKTYQEMKEALISKGFEEHARRRALIGPHADKIEFFINGKNARTYGSQGQQRSLVLSFKLAEVALIQDMLGQKPILLLDDVMSELDEQRRNALIRFISGDIQTFITTTNLQYFSQDILDHARIVELSNDPTEGNAL